MCRPTAATSTCRRRGRPRRRTRRWRRRSCPREKVKIHTTYMGGGFGRRGEGDFVADAVETSKAVGAPVKVVWSREDDMQHDFYRPISYARMSGAVDAAGNATVFQQHTVQQSLMKRIGALPPNGVDFISVDGSATLPYDIPNIKVEYTGTGSGHPVRVLALGRRVVPGLRGRRLHRRAGDDGGEGSLPVPTRPAAQGAASPRSARFGGREGRLGQTAAAGPRPRHRDDGGVRQHPRPRSPRYRWTARAP